ncbi:uncharacterized protein LOC135076594 [Ostrinia nubilalis]|uniref:uncharacterized protein LOC114358663 n=1 Tax=Ostrinia furnacalis TaxID=93504 RepID=UPI00103B416A|nr:uncharacterized protein LOC114358663 [Ostrinia furnacalis]
MLRTVVVISMFIVCCYCSDNNELLEDARAKKKKNPARLWAMILLLVVAKVAVVKVVSFFLFYGLFQKLFYVMGLVLKYFLNRAKTPNPVYGAPQEYNTVGYSYGPPEQETFNDHENLPSITELGGSLKWLFDKN